MELVETQEMMISSDYKERFKAEYYQVKTRWEKLHHMLVRAAAGTLTFDSTCPVDVLTKQSDIMEDYITILEVRAEIEGIEL